ncbi:MAG: HEPN domain-containing protein [Nitrospiraceae bacterium]|nr:MAG: HEPN domain-containing protein [Nitrospiraceae bacterium]
MVERIDKEEGRLRAIDEIERACSELDAAHLLHEKGFYFKSVSSAYYSIYHAAKALLLLKGIEPKTHEGIERMFGLYYIKTNEFDLAIGKTIGRLMKMREEADYFPEIPSTKDESDEAVRMAKDFTEKAKKLIS